MKKKLTTGLEENWAEIETDKLKFFDIIFCIYCLGVD